MADRTLTAATLADLVTLMTAAIGGLTMAKLVDPSGGTRLLDLGDAWQDPAWRAAVRAAWMRVNVLVGVTKGGDLLTLPAATAFDLVGDLVGRVDPATGQIHGTVRPVPAILTHYEDAGAAPSDGWAALVGFGLAGAAAGIVTHQLMRKP